MRTGLLDKARSGDDRASSSHKGPAETTKSRQRHEHTPVALPVGGAMSPQLNGPRLLPKESPAIRSPDMGGWDSGNSLMSSPIAGETSRRQHTNVSASSEAATPTRLASGHDVGVNMAGTPGTLSSLSRFFGWTTSESSYSEVSNSSRPAQAHARKGEGQESHPPTDWVAPLASLGSSGDF